MKSQVFKIIAQICFIVSPFALVCSGNGTGIIQCPLYLVLGFIFLCISEYSGVEKCEPSDFWKNEYKGFMLYNPRKVFNKDAEARKYASKVALKNNYYVPTNEEQDVIAREVKRYINVEKILKRNHVDRIQFGKYYLMKKEIEEIKKKEKEGEMWIDLDRRLDRELLIRHMERLCDHIEYLNARNVSYALHMYHKPRGVYDARDEFGTDNAKVIWDTALSIEERNAAIRWTNETMERLKKEKKEKMYVENKIEYLKKYRFTVYRKDLL